MKCKEELEVIRARHKGILRPKDVVMFAKNPKTALHSRFEWDDTAAAKEFRLEQARRIVRCTVVMLPKHNKSTHAYVSLISDRQGGDSYRAVQDVLASPLERQHLIQQALDEAGAWAKRHKDLIELTEVFDAIEAAGRGEVA